jgi:hypothetical protein
MHLPLLLLEELNFLERERTRSFFSGNPSLFRESLEESKTLNRVRAAHRYRARGAPVPCARRTGLLHEGHEWGVRAAHRLRGFRKLLHLRLISTQSLASRWGMP